MTQYIEHYRCNNAPCIHVDPALPIAEFDYLVGAIPPRYPVPAIQYVTTPAKAASFVYLWRFWNGSWMPETTYG